MKIALDITKKHQKQYNYDYYEVQEQGSNSKFIGTKEDMFAELEKFLDALKEEDD